MSSIRAWFTRYALQLVVLAIVIVSMYALYPEFRVQSSIERLIPLGVIAAGLAGEGVSRVSPLETVERGYSRLVERLRALGGQVERIT